MRDVVFPATKQDLIDAADDAEAPQQLIERLQQLTLEQYESRAELTEELRELDEEAADEPEEDELDEDY